MINELRNLLLNRYQVGLEKRINDRNVTFDHVDGLYYKNNKISFRRVGSCLGSPEQLKTEKATINPQKSDEKVFQYAITVALNHEKLKNIPKD